MHKNSFLYFTACWRELSLTNNDSRERFYRGNTNLLIFSELSVTLMESKSVFSAFVTNCRHTKIRISSHFKILCCLILQPFGLIFAIGWYMVTIRVISFWLKCTIRAFLPVQYLIVRSFFYSWFVSRDIFTCFHIERNSWFCLRLYVCLVHSWVPIRSEILFYLLKGILAPSNCLRLLYQCT